MRNPALAALALALAACSEPAAPEAPAAPKAPAAAVAPAAPAVPAPGVTPPAGDAAPLAPVAVLGADHSKGRMPEGQEKEALRAMPALAEIELAGTFTGAKGAAYVVHVLPGPCDLLVAAKGTSYGGTHPAPGETWSTEVFAPRGAPVHVCAAALDLNDEVIAYGGWQENPQAFSEEGENQRSGVVLTLAALPGPKPLAKLELLNQPTPADGLPPPVPPALKAPLGARPR